MTAGVLRHMAWRAGAAAAALSALLLAALPAQAQVSVNIGIDVPVYPQLVRVPGYPVYYAPQASANYFFYDGLYWVYRDDMWYQSAWYNGPWQSMAPERVPVFVLRVPVRYYRQPPPYFRGWHADAAPHWGEHWGPAWQQHRAGWDHWDRARAPAPAPLPRYQQQYSGEHYPSTPERQTALRVENSHYRPREAVAQQQWHESEQRHAAPAPEPHQPQERQQSHAPAHGGNERGESPGAAHHDRSNAHERGREAHEPEHGGEHSRP